MDDVTTRSVSQTVSAEDQGNELLMRSGRCPGGGRGRTWARIITEIEKLSDGMFLSLKEVTR